MEVAAKQSPEGHNVRLVDSWDLSTPVEVAAKQPPEGHDDLEDIYLAESRLVEVAAKQPLLNTCLPPPKRRVTNGHVRSYSMSSPIQLKLLHLNEQVTRGSLARQMLAALVRRQRKAFWGWRKTVALLQACPSRHFVLLEEGSNASWHSACNATEAAKRVFFEEGM